MWIIESKKWRGKIEYKASTLTGIDMHLFVGGEDRTSEVEKIYRLVIPVAQMVETALYRSIRLSCSWGELEALRDSSSPSQETLQTRRGVDQPPRLLARLINEPGPLDEEAVTKVGRVLNSHLKPR